MLIHCILNPIHHHLQREALSESTLLDYRGHANQFVDNAALAWQPLLPL